MPRVLLIEDDHETANEIMAELVGRGFDVDWAATGIEGLDKARAGEADAMIVDRLLPGVRELGELYEPIAEDKRVIFTVGAREDVVVRGDRDLLFETMANLVDNAVKFTPEGGTVEVSLARVGDEGVVRVRDNGPGIAAAERDLVTRRFYRSDKSRRDPGLGLGLSLVAAIAKLHGFRFSISPGPGCVAEVTGERLNI